MRYTTARSSVRSRLPLCGSQARFLPAIECSKSTVRTHHRSCRHPKGLSGTVLGLQSFCSSTLCRQRFPSWAPSQPRTKMFFIGKLAHIGSHFHHNRLRQGSTHSLYSANVHATDTLQVLANLDILWGILCYVCSASCWKCLEFMGIRLFPIRADQAIQAFDLCIAHFNLLCIEIIELQRLLQDK